MSVEPLLDRLVADLRPVRHRRPSRDLAAIAALVAIEVAMVIASGHMRPDMPHAMRMPSFWWKLAGVAGLGAVGLVTAIASLAPTGSPRRGLRRLGALALGVLALGWLVDLVQVGEEQAGAGLWQRLDPAHGLDCAGTIVMLAVPLMLALGLLMRRGASTDPGGSAWAAGAAASCGGALAFIVACPDDDPVYLAIWYGAAGLAVAGIARLVLPRLTRW